MRSSRYRARLAPDGAAVTTPGIAHRLRSGSGRGGFTGSRATRVREGLLELVELGKHLMGLPAGLAEGPSGTGPRAFVLRGRPFQKVRRLVFERLPRRPDPLGARRWRTAGILARPRVPGSRRSPDDCHPHECALALRIPFIGYKRLLRPAGPIGAEKGRERSRRWGWPYPEDGAGNLTRRASAAAGSIRARFSGIQTRAACSFARSPSESRNWRVFSTV